VLSHRARLLGITVLWIVSEAEKVRNVRIILRIPSEIALLSSEAFPKIRHGTGGSRRALS
jgi:hypothetical protein